MLYQEFTLLIQIFKHLRCSLFGAGYEYTNRLDCKVCLGFWRRNIKRAEGGLGVLDFVEWIYALKLSSRQHQPEPRPTEAEELDPIMILKEHIPRKIWRIYTRYNLSQTRLVTTLLQVESLQAEISQQYRKRFPFASCKAMRIRWYQLVIQLSR